jgi:hypothetical protein
MTDDLFAGEGVGALIVASIMVVVAAATLLWLRGPGARPHEPPVAQDRVRYFALGLILFAVLTGIRAFWGIGGFLVASAITLIVLGAAVVARRGPRRS